MPAKKAATRKRSTSTTKASANQDANAVSEFAANSEKVAEASKDVVESIETACKTVSCLPHPALNIRKEPNSDAEVIGEYKNGAEVPCEKPVKGWAKTDDGYVMSKFLV